MPTLTPRRPVRSVATAGVRRALRSRVVATMTTPHGVDSYLQQLNPGWAVHEVRARIVDIHHETADAVTLTLKPNSLWRGAQAGQYVQIGVEVGGRRRTRCFSISSSAHRRDGLLQISVKAHPDGYVSRHLKERARVGNVVILDKADGEFVVTEDRPRRLLLITGGSGITPAMAILRTLTDEGYDGHITFLHYSPAPADQFFAAELEEIAAAHDNVDIRLCYPEAGEGALTGFFSRGHLAACAPDYADTAAYVCGPEPLAKAVQAVWTDDGLSDQLIVEFFQPPSAPPLAEGEQGTVEFARSGLSTDNTGKSLLEQAEAAGLTPEYGCRRGICFTCTSVKKTGCVRNLITGEESDDADEQIRICVSAPVGNVEMAL